MGARQVGERLMPGAFPGCFSFNLRIKENP
jgi:hypothetical protein